jgi:NAD(P)H-hydrate epimerase
VIDADALNGLSKWKDWPQFLKSPSVLTPHPGEMARLLDATIEEVQHDRLKSAVDAAAKWKQTVVLKGAHTIIATPDGRVAISPYANPLLAVAGTGDVLAGTIAGLLAQGMQPFEAAACGVYVHGYAAEELSGELGDRGLLASELLPAIPRAIRTIIHGKRQTAGPAFGGLAGLGSLANLSDIPGLSNPPSA